MTDVGMSLNENLSWWMGDFGKIVDVRRAWEVVGNVIPVECRRDGEFALVQKVLSVVDSLQNEGKAP